MSIPPETSVSFYDGLVSPELFARLVGGLAWVPMYFQRRADRDPAAHPLDSYSFYPLVTVENKLYDDGERLLSELDPTLAPIHEVWQLVRKTAGNVRLYECEYTANAFGSEGHPHHDCLVPDRRSEHVTVIVYCNDHWELSWAGETVAFDVSGDITGAVMPKPGRITVIRGDPLHAARGISRTCPHPRRVLVFKMWQQDAQNTSQ